MIPSDLALVTGTALLLAPLAALHATDREKQIETRRGEYLDWIVQHFGKMEPTMDPRDFHV